MPKYIIIAENLIALFLGIYFYYVFQGNWLIFMVLFLVPDISMAGYLINKRLGSYVYNLIHNYALAFLVLVVAAFTTNDFLAQISFILVAHVALDRVLGFGLKYPTHFKDSHMQKLSVRQHHSDE